MAEHLVGIIKESQENCDVDPVDKSSTSDGKSVQSSAARRAARIMDALANVLVSKSQSEVVAVAAQNDEQNKRVILTIATNSTVEEHTKCHAKVLWKDLREISENSLRPYVKVTEFKRHVYGFSFPKLLRRLTEQQQKQSFDSLHAVIKRLPEFSNKTDKIEALQRSLQSVAERFANVLELLDNSGGKLPEGSEFHCFCFVMDSIYYSVVHEIFKDKHQVDCLNWADSCLETHTSRFLSKITSLTKSVKILVRFACSRRMRSRLLQGKELHIDGVPSSSCSLTLPSTQDGLKSIAREALQSQQLSLQPSDKHPGRSMHGYYNNASQNDAPAIDAPVHCECALVLHLLNPARQNGGPPPLSYIGVSKPSCDACRKFLKCLRERNVIFQVRSRRTHTK